MVDVEATRSSSRGLGVQMVLTLFFASLMSRLMSTHFSLARRLLSNGLVVYSPPSNEELRALLGPSKKSKRSVNSNSKKEEERSKDVFTFNRNLNFRLELSSLQFGQIVQLRFFDDFQWLVDFALYATLVYLSSEVYHLVLPSRAAAELNLSLLWLLLAVGFALRALLTLTTLFFSGNENNGERSLLLVMFAFYMLTAMLVLVAPDNLLENRLDDAHEALSKTSAMLKTGLTSHGLASKLMLKLVLSTVCALLGSLFTFPGLRLARMQADALLKANNSKMILLHLNYVAPLAIVAMWVPLITREPLTQTVYKGMEQPMLSESQFESLRLHMIVGSCLMRLLLTSTYLQSYLDLAYTKVEQLRREAGKITNVEVQQSVSRIFHYLIVVALQYLAPVIVILNLTLLLKTMGGGSWNVFTSESQLESMQSPALNSSVINEGNSSSFEWTTLREMFNADVCNGLLGFMTWWCCFVWFLSAAIGTAYHSYFSKA